MTDIVVAALPVSFVTFNIFKHFISVVFVVCLKKT